MVDESAAISSAAQPGTVSSLLAGLQTLGVAPGQTLIGHSSLSALGWIAGGAQAVVEALLTAVDSTGTLVMPSQSSHLSDPAALEAPPVPEAWHATIRAEMPAYDPALTPTRGMGAIVETFRHVPGAVRSAHPQVSFTAVGPNATFIVGEHSLAPQFGESSPLGRLYELDASVLLLGVGHANNTSLHLAEHRASWPSKSTTELSAPILVDGRREWATWTDLEHDEDDFDQIGTELARLGLEHTGQIGAGTGRLCSVRAIVDAAADWMTANRR